MSRRFDPEGAIFLVVDVARLSRARFEQRVAEARLGLTPAEARVLAAVDAAGPIRQTMLARHLNVARMSLTGFLERLDAAGLVARRGDPVDRRAKLVTLTAAAEPVLAALSDIAAEVSREARGDIPAEEWDRFRETARAARGNLCALRQNGERG